MHLVNVLLDCVLHADCYSNRRVRTLLVLTVAQVQEAILEKFFLFEAISVQDRQFSLIFGEFARPASCK